jgi:hypothetical protein
VFSRWQGGFAAAFVTLVACALVVLDVTDGGMRRWWDGHALTTDTVAGLLVLLITVLVVDQVVRLRQINDRAQAVAVQAAILVSQANRTTRAVSQAADGSGDRDAANNEFRTYVMMLLAVAPVLIDAKLSRAFLEKAQSLSAEMARTLNIFSVTPDQEESETDRLEESMHALRVASSPLVRNLNPAVRNAVSGNDAADQ